MHGAIGLGVIIAMIAFAFGERAAKIVVGSILIAGILFVGHILVIAISRGGF